MKTTIKIIPFLLGAVLVLTGMNAQAASSDSEVLMELYQRLEVMGKEINVLRGENETLKHDLTRLKTDQKRAFLAIDERLEQSEKKQAARAVSTPPKAVAVKPAAPVRPAAPSKPAVAKPVVAKPVPAKPVAAKPAPAKAVVKAAPRSVNPSAKVEYTKAYETLKKNRQAGIAAFKTFLTKYANDPLAENAHYWIGEAWYSQKNYRGAIESFVVVLNKYKAGRKAPDAAVKLGYSFYALKDWAMAKRTFNDVLRFFPNTHAAQLAKARLAKMKQEGH